MRVDSLLCCTTGAENDTTSPMLLLLYEFEAKARLDDPDAEKVVDRAMCLAQAEPKLFEAIAGNFSANSRRFSVFCVLNFIVVFVAGLQHMLHIFHFISCHCYALHLQPREHVNKC